ncbi:hypothetical protein BH24ACT26_BH24ACT26_20230 [soil metagenome]
MGASMLTWANKGRIAGQRGVGAVSGAKTLVTLAALGATGYARVLGQRVMNAGDVPVAGGTTPDAETPPDVADAQRQLDRLRWAIAGLTGTLLWLNAYMGEQQRTTEVARGVWRRVVRS